MIKPSHLILESIGGNSWHEMHGTFCDDMFNYRYFDLRAAHRAQAGICRKILFKGLFFLA